MHGKVVWIGHWIPCCIRGCKCDSRDVCSCTRLNTTQAILIDGVLIPSVIIFGCGAYIESHLCLSLEPNFESVKKVVTGWLHGNNIFQAVNERAI